MKKLNDKEMKSINGGGIGVMGFFGIGTLITFLAGIIDGFARPIKCN